MAAPLREDRREARLDAQRLDERHLGAGLDLRGRQVRARRFGVERRALREGNGDDGLLARQRLDARGLDLGLDGVELFSEGVDFGFEDRVAVSEGEGVEVRHNIDLHQVSVISDRVQTIRGVTACVN